MIWMSIIICLIIDNIIFNTRIEKIEEKLKIKRYKYKIRIQKVEVKK